MAPASGSNSVWKGHDPHCSMYVICRDIVVADVLKDGSVDAVVLHLDYHAVICMWAMALIEVLNKSSQGLTSLFK